jgi:cellulose synthase/poly-beta-1,6-N-acetylglucosamine synthase-like glycosyltransferase
MRSIEIPQPEDRDWRYRAFEILPAVLTYIVLLLPIILGKFSPKVAAYFVVAYLLLWFIRAIGLNIRSVQGWRMINQHKKLPWPKLNDDLETLQPSTPGAPKWHARNVKRVGQHIPEHRRINPSQVYHAVIIAFYNETQDVVEPTVQSLLDSDYDPKKMIMILAYEERGGPEVEAMAGRLIKKFGKKFYHAQAVKHPGNISGEVIGKGGNVTYAGRRLKDYLEKAKIDPAHVLVTTLDSDNRPDKQYFGALTYTYCSTEEPKHASYQPVPMFLNNIWDAPAPMRVIATGNSFWNVVLSMRPHMLRNFSSHAQPMTALIDTDFWSVRTIVEDGHQFWRTWFRYDGNHDVFPIFIPIYQDAVLTEKYRKTLKMQFVQVRRWAWGASDIAYFANQAFFKMNNIPRHKKIAKGWRLLEGHLGWSTAPFILLLAVYPTFLFHSSTFLGNELPQYASNLQRIAMVGIIISLFLSMRSLPPKPLRYRRHRTIWMVLQWVYLPLTTIVYSACAAIYSQTRLALGKYLGFIVTEKATKSERVHVTQLMK